MSNRLKFKDEAAFTDWALENQINIIEHKELTTPLKSQGNTAHTSMRIKPSTQPTMRKATRKAQPKLYRSRDKSTRLAVYGLLILSIIVLLLIFTWNFNS